MRPKGKVGIVLTVLAGVGMVVTIVLAAKKAPEANKLKEEALEQKRQKTGDENARLTKLESIKAQAPCYTPVIFSAVMTAGSLVGSQLLPQSSINEIETWCQTYKNINTKLNGEKLNQMAENMTAKKIAQGTDVGEKETFVLKFDGKDILFDSTEMEVLAAEYEANRRFRVETSKGVTFNELLDIFHVDERVTGGDDVGWQQTLGEEFYGYVWIDFVHRKGMLNGIPVTYIDMPFPCHALEEYDSELSNHGTDAMW